MPQSSRPIVPEGWATRWDERYQTWFYVNLRTRESQWEHPRLPQGVGTASMTRRELDAMGVPERWTAEWDGHHKDLATEESHWEKLTTPARNETKASVEYRGQSTVLNTSAGSSANECVNDVAPSDNNEASPAAGLPRVPSPLLYEALPPRSFRLLKLHAGLSSAPLSGTLQQPRSLDERPSFDALSYRWSPVDPDHPKSIAIDGMPFNVGPELHVALLQFRLEQIPRRLWIDQICINQRNPAEKLEQIRIMGEIYNKADRVLIWLGTATSQSDVGMELLPLFLELVSRNENRAKAEKASQTPSTLVPNGGVLARSLRDLFDRPWFGRVWTLQEVALARQAEVWCGDKVFPFRLLEIFNAGVDQDEHGHWAGALQTIGNASGGKDPENPDRPALAHTRIVSLLKQGSLRGSARVLNALRQLDSTDDKDRVYAVLDFLDRQTRQTIMSKDQLSCAQLYQLVAVHGLKNGEMEFLGAAGLSQHSQSSVPHRPSSEHALILPSWVPDWTYKVQTHSYWVQDQDRLSKEGTHLYAAGGPLPNTANCRFSDLDRLLHIPGMLFDDIDLCTEPFVVIKLPGELTDTQHKRNLVTAGYGKHQSFIASSMKLAKICANTYGRDGVELACKHSLIGGMAPEGSHKSNSGIMGRSTDEATDALFEDFQVMVSYFEAIQESIRKLMSGERDEDLTDMSARIQDLEEMTAFTTRVDSSHNLLEAMPEACKGRRFFTTKNKQYMGVGPKILDPALGDKICILPGCCAPFVIRPIGHRYQLIGECYVHGIMDGEALKGNTGALREIVLE